MVQWLGLTLPILEEEIDWSLDGEHERTNQPVTVENVHRAIRLVFPKSVDISHKKSESY